MQRSLDGGDDVLLDSVGGKTFTDETVPVGTQNVSYTVKAKRGTQMSAWSEALTVRFGRVGDYFERDFAGEDGLTERDA